MAVKIIRRDRGTQISVNAREPQWTTWVPRSLRFPVLTVFRRLVLVVIKLRVRGMRLWVIAVRHRTAMEFVLGARRPSMTVKSHPVLEKIVSRGRGMRLWVLAVWRGMIIRVGPV